MKKLIYLVMSIAMTLFAADASAQYIPVTASSCIVDGSGSTITSGTLIVVGTDSNDNPVVYRAGSTFITTTAPITKTITSGSVPSFQLADPASSSPLNVSYRFVVQDNTTKKITVYKGINITPNDVLSGGVFTTFNICKMNPGAGVASFGGFTTPSLVSGDWTVTRDLIVGRNASVAGTLGAKQIDTFSDCSNSVFANTAACQTDASTTGGMFFPPNYSIGAFTNSSNRPVLNITKVDWRGFVSVKDFGAKGDGTTDDTTAIQATINFVCTGSSTTVPTANLCPNAVSGNAVGGTVYFPAGDYHYSSPILVYGGITLRGAGKLATKLTKTTNTVGSGSITAGTGVGRSPTACGGGTCVDSFAVDSLISVPYISSGNTDYAYRWTIRDMAIYGSGANGTKYGIYAPRSAQAEMKNLYIFMNCTKGAPINCGSVQGSGFFTEDAWLMRHEGNTVDSSYIGWNHVNDGSSLGAGTSSIFEGDWGVNIGCSGFHFFGLSYSSLIASAIDNYNKQSVDLAATDVTCAPYSFNTVAGMSINGGGAENLNGAVMYAAASSVSVSGGFKTFGQTGYTSAGTLASLLIDSAATVTFNGTSFSAVTSPGNLLNIVLQGGSTLIDTNSTLPSGGNTFIGYGGGSLKTDSNISGITLTNASGTQNITATSNLTRTIANGTATMTTAAIASGACGTTVTVAATGVLTTDVIDPGFNAAIGANPGVLIPHAWPTANNVNFNYCNPTAASVTPSAATLNWSVRR